MHITKYKRVISINVLLLAAAAGTPAQAADAGSVQPASAPTPYVQASVGPVRLSSPPDTGTALDLAGSKRSTTYKLTGGVQLDPRFGVEVTYFHLPGSAMATSAGAATYKGSVVAAQLAGTMPLTAAAALVGRIGLGRSDLSVNVPSAGYGSSARRSLLAWGVGARFALTPRIDLTLDYDDLGSIAKYEQGGGVKATELSAGVRFKF